MWVPENRYRSSGWVRIPLLVDPFHFNSVSLPCASKVLTHWWSYSLSSPGHFRYPGMLLVQIFPLMQNHFNWLILYHCITAIPATLSQHYSTGPNDGQYSMQHFNLILNMTSCLFMIQGTIAGVKFCLYHSFYKLTCILDMLHWFVVGCWQIKVWNIMR